MTCPNGTLTQSSSQDFSGLPLFDVSARVVPPDSNTGAASPLRPADGCCTSSLDNGCIKGRGEEGEEVPEVAFTVGPGGLIVKQRCDNIPPPVGGDRGPIRGFSRSSRRRLLRRNAVIDWAAHPAYFVTLTYHEDFPPEYRAGTAHLKAFRKRLERVFNRCFIAAEWRREWKPRKSGEHEGYWAPHYHLVLMLSIEVGPSMLADLLRALWNEIVAPGDRTHFYHGAHVRRVYNAKGPRIAKLMSYLAKYISKEADGVPVDIDTGECLEVGRSWGIWGDLPEAAITGSMSREDLVLLLRRLRRWSDNPFAAKLTDHWLGFLLFADGYAISLLLRGLESVEVA